MNPELASIEALTSIAGVIDPKVTPDKIEDSLKLPDKLTRRLRKWMIDPELKTFKLPKRRDAEETWEIIGHQFKAAYTPALASAFDSLAFQAKVQECRTELTKRYPVQFARDKLQDLPLDPSPDEQHDWLALVSVIEDEYRILDEIEMGTLTPEQTNLYKAMFPEIYGHLAMTANMTIIDEYDAKERQIPEIVESTLEIFLNEFRPEPIQTPAAAAETPAKTPEISAQPTQSESAEA